LAGRWLLKHALGSGGAGTVYEAFDSSAGRVAVKVLHAELTSNTESTLRFALESGAANLVRHRGVARIHDSGATSDGVPFFVMDLLPGDTLERRVARAGPLGIPLVLRVAQQLLEILVTTHASGIVHRDLKPSNILISAEDRIYLLDFGACRVEGGSNVTRPGIALGTAEFMPPEQAAGNWGAVDERSDLWGLAAVLLFALEGRSARSGSYTARVLEAARTAPIRLTEFVGMGPALSALIARALAFEPSERFASASAMLDSTNVLVASIRTATWREPPRRQLQAPNARPRERSAIERTTSRSSDPARQAPRQRGGFKDNLWPFVLLAFITGAVLGMGYASSPKSKAASQPECLAPGHELQR
jgi:serine/threonine-protein kinase